MRFIMKQKLFSLRDSFEIKDEHEVLAFTAKSKFFSLRKSFQLKDADDQNVASIKQQLLAIKPKFLFENSLGQTALLKKHFFPLFSHKFTLFVGNEQIEITGNILGHEYEFIQRGDVIAQVSKQWFSWSDTYGVDVASQEDVWFVISTVIAIDCLIHGDKNSTFD